MKNSDFAPQNATSKTGEIDPKALFRIGYGLYVVSARENGQDNGMIANAVVQVTNSPNRIAVTLNKESLTAEMILHTGVMTVSCLTVNAPYAVFERFGLQSGRTVSKFEGFAARRTANGTQIPAEHINAFFSLSVEQTVDLDTHYMFICSLTEAQVLEDAPTMTYDYYYAQVKPKKQAAAKKGYICRICGYVFEGDPLPEDFICPLCKHGAADFEPL